MYRYQLMNDGYWYVVVKVGGKMYLIHRVGKSGHCLYMPGRKGQEIGFRYITPL